MARNRGWGLAAARPTVAWLIASALVASALVAACSTPVVTPPPSTPAPTWDPRRDVIDQAEAVWEAQRPDTYAYTASVAGDVEGAVTTYRVTGMDGRVEIQPVAGEPVEDAAASVTVEGLYEAVRSRLDADGTLDFTVDELYGYLSSATFAAATGGGSWTRSIGDFVTAATRTSAARAREALAQAQARWRAVRTPAWEYTWTRFPAADGAGRAVTWRVRHEDGATTASTAGGTADATPPGEVTIAGTVSSLASVLAAGGWVDVSSDAVTGLDMLVAVDPSPSVKGDAYWIRIDTTDLAAAHAAEALAAARDRWSGAGLKRYSYTWRFEGPGRTWTYRVSVNGGKVTVKAGTDTPPPDEAFAGPGVEDMLDLVERVIAGGGTVSAGYDRKLGYPTRIVLPAATGTTPQGEITISRFRTR